jgi:hypothetical protein
MRMQQFVQGVGIRSDVHAIGVSLPHETLRHVPSKFMLDAHIMKPLH